MAKLTPFDAAKYLDSAEAIAAYLVDALEEGSAGAAADDPQRPGGNRMLDSCAVWRWDHIYPTPAPGGRFSLSSFFFCAAASLVALPVTLPPLPRAVRPSIGLVGGIPAGVGLRWLMPAPTPPSPARLHSSMPQPIRKQWRAVPQPDTRHGRERSH
jgi:hypothetical protein